MPGKILGLDINDDFIAAVQVASSLKGHQITACARIRIEGDDGLDSALKALFERADLKSDVCHSSIPAEHVSYRNLQLPFKDQKKIRQTLPFEIETMVPFPIEKLLVDFSIIERSEQSKVLAASVEKAVISTHLDRLLSHGVDPDVLDIRCVPVVLWLLKQKETPENGLFLQMDGKKNTMVLFLERRIVLVRSFVFNGAPNIGAASERTSENTAATQAHEQTASYGKAFCTLVRNTVHGYGAQNNMEIRPEKILYTGTRAIIPETEGLLGSFFDIPAEQVDPGKDEKVSMDANIARVWNPALMVNALALALRDTKSGQGFNFRKDEFEKKKHYFGSRKEIRSASIFFIILLCFLCVNIGSDYYFLKKSDEALNQKIIALFKDTFPEIKKIPHVMKVKDRMKSEIERIKESSVSHPAIGGNNLVMELLKEISQRIPESVTMHITRMVVDSEAVRISGTTDTYNTVDKIKSDLESSACFSKGTIGSSKLDRSGDKVEFEIKLERAR